MTQYIPVLLMLDLLSKDASEVIGFSSNDFECIAASHWGMK